MSDYETVAILDEDTDILNLYTFSLSEFGFSVKGFFNHESLLEYIRNYPNEIGFLIMEYKMKHMTGCDLAKQVNSKNPKIKMAFVTGYDNIVNNKLQLEVIKKPIKLTQMLKLVKKYMN
ncbi:MAG TPA: response regulator [Nitrososphaeraceae archaeon]|nr:response regulator [Nitrososphaeraceae archaeon]